MIPSIQIKLAPEAEATRQKVQTLPQWILQGIADAMKRENTLTVSHIQEKYLSFPRQGPSVPIGLRTVSGSLRQKLWASDPVINGQVVGSAIGDNATSGGVNYAAVHEFGATIPAHDVVAHGKALRFRVGDRVLFRKRVHIPTVELPARAPIQHGIEDRQDEYGESISDEILKLWEKP